METLIHKVKFKVSLSNGQTFYEGKTPFEEISGQKSPWQRLIQYTVDNKCDITSLSLYTDDGKTFNLPSNGKNPRFREFANQKEKPIDFDVRRAIAYEQNVIRQDNKVIPTSDKRLADFYTIAVAIYPSYSLQLWVDEQDPRNCWVLVV